MKIQFATKKLQKIMTKEKELKKKFGDDGARRVQSRLSQLEAADTLDDLRKLPGRCHELSGDLKNHLAVDLQHPYRLIFRPVEPVPTKKDGGLDWTRVIEVVVIDVIDYH